MWEYLILYYKADETERDYKVLRLIATSGTKAVEDAEVLLGSGYRVSQVVAGGKVSEMPIG